MSTNSSTKEEEIEDQVQEGWKSKHFAWGLSAFGCAVRFHSRFVFPEKRTFYVFMPSCRPRYTLLLIIWRCIDRARLLVW